MCAATIFFPTEVCTKQKTLFTHTFYSFANKYRQIEGQKNNVHLSLKTEVTQSHSPVIYCKVLIDIERRQRSLEKGCINGVIEWIKSIQVYRMLFRQ